MNDIFVRACIAAALAAVFVIPLAVFGAPWWAFLIAAAIAGALSR